MLFTVDIPLRVNTFTSTFSFHSFWSLGLEPWKFTHILYQILPFIYVHKSCHIYLSMHLLTTDDPWVYQNNHRCCERHQVYIPPKQGLGDLDAHSLTFTSREVRVVVYERPMKMMVHGCGVSAFGGEDSCVISLDNAFFRALLRVLVLFHKYTDFSLIQGWWQSGSFSSGSWAHCQCSSLCALARKKSHWSCRWEYIL